MKKLMISALLSTQILTAAQPALAAELVEAPAQQTGAFAGFRMRVPLDGDARQRQMRAGLTLSPTLHGRDLNGNRQIRIGEGLELGVNGGDRVQVSLAGTPVSRLAQGPAGPGGRRAGVSTLGWVAIGAGVVVLAVGGFYWWLIEEAGDCDPGEC